MYKRILAIAALAAFVAVAAIAPAHEAPQPAPPPPAVVIRLASLDNLFEQLGHLGGVLGGENLTKNLDESIKAKLGPKGLYGIDRKQPIGLYARIGADISDLTATLMVPVTSEKEFKQMLGDLGWEISEPKDGVHTVKQNLLPMDVTYRVQGGYAYVGLLGNEALAKANLLAPNVVFPAKAGPAISLTVRLDQIPAGARDMFLEVIKDGLGKVEEKAGEGKGQKVLRDALAKEVQRVFTNVLTDGEELNAGIDIDPKTKQMVLDVRLSAKAKSTLAANVAKMGQRKTLFAGVLDPDAALNAALNFEVSADLSNAMASMLQEALGTVNEKLQDETKRKQAQRLIDAIKPSLTSGDLDAAVSLRGPHKSNHFTMIAGFKLKDGAKLSATLLELVKDLPAGEQKAIELNAEKVGTVGIHRLALQSSFDADTKALFGDHPLYVALREDALFLAMGEEGLAAIKTALAATPQTAPAARLDLSMARFARLMKKDGAAPAEAQKLLAAGDGARLQVVLEGGADLHLRCTMALSAMKLFSLEK